jgi:soluble lytic murein transglycosylase
MKYKVIIIICSLFFSITSEANTKNNYNAERVKYIKALKYFKKKNFREFENLKKELVHYPLYANLEYKSLHRKRDINDDDIIKFIQKYKKSYLSEKAYINLIYRLSRKNLSKKLVLNYQDIGSVELHCLYLRAKIKQKLLLNIEDEIIPIWLNAKSQPKSCDYIFRWFYKNKKLTDELVWQRIKMALDVGNYNLANYLKRFLSNKNKVWASSLLKVYKNPRNNILSRKFKKDNRFRDTILSYGIDKIAKKDYKLAKKYLVKIKSLFKVSDQYYNKKILDIYIIGLKTYQENIFTDKDFSLIKSKNLEFIIASANYSIFNSNWNTLLKSIAKLPDSIAQEEKWLYWKGKALYKTKNISNSSLEVLSKNRSYYGFLAAHILNKQPNIVNKKYPIASNDLNYAETSYEVKRLYELYILGKKRDARKELQYVFKNSNFKDFNILNSLFEKWGWNEGAILGYGITKYFDDVEVRFPVMYEKYFNENSNSNIRKSILLGIARKESIFSQYAKSSAGALGIMQVLPSTAHWVLKRIKGKEVSKNYLYNKKINILIGSYYFNYLYSMKRSYVEAIASYNAGPNVVTKWRKKNKSSEDAWIEFIPYSETKKYVKLVLEYSLVYDWVLNKRNTIRVSQIIDVKK